MTQNPSVTIRPVHSDDTTRLDEIRHRAFAPVFASFRAILGPNITQLTQTNSDAEQSQYLMSILAPDSDWEVYVATLADNVVGFVSLQLNHTTTVGEIGLNAVHPDWASAGIGNAARVTSTTRHHKDRRSRHTRRISRRAHFGHAA